jgi:hypothetical protein
VDITRAIAHGHYDASKSHICPTGRTSMHMRAECAAPLTATPPQPPASARGSLGLLQNSGSLEARPRGTCRTPWHITGPDDNDTQGASAQLPSGRAAPGWERIARTLPSIHVVDGGLAPLLVADDDVAPGARAGAARTSGEHGRAFVGRARARGRPHLTEGQPCLISRRKRPAASAPCRLGPVDQAEARVHPCSSDRLLSRS